VKLSAVLPLAAFLMPLAGVAHDHEPEPATHLVITRQVGGYQAPLDRLSAQIRKEQGRKAFQPSKQCPKRVAPNYRKKVVVAGFELESAHQGDLGGLYRAGEQLSRLVYQRLRETGRVIPLAAPDRQMFASLAMAPTAHAAGNRLARYSPVSREMGAQFVVSGVIRNIEVSDRLSWGSSYASRLKGALFGKDSNRSLVVDLIVHDGYTGRVLVEERFSGSGRWGFDARDRVAFGSDRFFASDFGAMADKLIDGMVEKVIRDIECQPLMVKILDVDGKDLVLDVGTNSGMLPGEHMELVRAEHSLGDPERPPELWETDVSLHVHSITLDRAQAWMPQYGGAINVRAGDYAVVY
jgi:hypothetical protein